MKNNNVFSNLEDSTCSDYTTNEEKLLNYIKEYLGDIGRELCIIRGTVGLFVILEILAMLFVFTL